MSSIHSGQYVTVVNLTAEATMPVNTAFCQSFYENPLFLSQDTVPSDDQQLTKLTKPPSNEFITVLDVSDDSIELESTANTDRDIEGRREKRSSSECSSARPQTGSESGEEVMVYRLTGERLGLGLKFVGGEAGTQPVDQVIIRCCADDSPAARATSSWGGLKEGDRMIRICGVPVTQLTRTECVRLLRDTPLQVALVMQRTIGKRATLISQDSGIALGDDFTELGSDGVAQMGSGGVLSSDSAHEGSFAASDDQGASGIWAEALGHFETLEREFGLSASLDALKPLAPPAVFRDADCLPDQLADDPLACTPEPTATDSDEGFHDTYMTPSGVSNDTSGRDSLSPSDCRRVSCMVAPDIQHSDSSCVGVIHEGLPEASASPQFEKSFLHSSDNRKAADTRSITKEPSETSHQSDAVLSGGAENRPTGVLNNDHERRSSGDNVDAEASVLIRESHFGETERSSAQTYAATCDLERHPKPMPRRRSKTTTDAIRTAASTTSPLHTSTVSPLNTFTVSPLHTSTVSPLHTSTVSPLHTSSTVSPLHPVSTVSPLHTSTVSPLHTSTVSPLHISTVSPLRTSTVSPLHTSTVSPLHTYTVSPLHTSSTVSQMHTSSTVSPMHPASTASPLNSASGHDVSMVSVQSSWLLDATDPSRSMGKRSWQSSSGESSPPSFPRLPPDGHEFPPQFDDLPLIRPPGDFLDECGFKETKQSANRPLRDVRISPSDISGLREQMKKEISNITGTSKPQNRSTRGRVSVRDKIALFSSQSVEHLAPKHERLNKQNSINGDYSGNHFTGSSQERSKSDLKLEKVDRSSGSWTGVSKRKNSDPCGAKYGSLTDVFPGNGKRVLSRETVTAQRTECFHMSRNSVDRASDETDCVPQLSERSQSLVQLNNSEKTHSPSGVPWRGPSFNPPTSLSRKVSLNAISEERRKNISKLRGLVIPNKVDGLTKKGPTDLPTIKSKSPSSHTASGFRRTPKQLSPTTPPKEIANNKKAVEITHLSTLPWKGDTPTFPKYSPAFKRKNISLCISSNSLNLSPPGLSSPVGRLGGSNLELSDHDHIASANRFSRALHKEMELMREPLQRSSSLNSRPLPTNIKVCRNISDEALLPESNQSLISPEDVTSSTLTLVNEPLSDVAEVATNRSRSGSVDQDIAAHSSLLHNGLNIGADLRASSSTLHGSPIKEIDIDSTNSESEHPLGDRQEWQMVDIILPVPVDISPTRTSPPTRMEKDSCSPPKIIEDTAWLKSANSVRNGRTPLGDLVRLKKVKKPSVKSLTEKWQQLSDTSDRSSQSSDSRPDSLDLTSPRQSPSKESMSPTSPQSPTSCTIESENFLNSLDWPSVDNNRVSRKLSTPSYSCPGVKLREKREGVLSRPTSLVETDRISTDLDSYLVGMTEVSSTSIAGSDSLDCCKSSASSTSSLLDMLTANLKRTAGSRHVLSVTDLRRAFERSDGRPTHGHARMSSLDSNASEDSIFYHQLTGISGGSMTSLVTGTRDHYGSITSLASSTSLISPHELQLLIEDANQSLEESGTPSHEIIVAVLHREIMGGSIGVTLAGGADYENKEISVNKVLNGSVADRDGRIKKGDRVISINGRSMKGMTHREALNILKAPRAEVVLVLSRSRSVTPLDSTPTDDGCGFQRPSYVNHISSRPPKILESPMDSKSLATELQFVDVPRGPPLSITLQKEGAGLGFSLQGGKDSPLGDRPLVAKKIFTGGAADKSGLLDVGDQILSINDTAVTQMARIEAWNFLKKQLDGPVRLNIRKKLIAPSIDAFASPSIEASVSLSSTSACETSPDSSVGCRSPVEDTAGDRPLQLVCIPVTEQLPGRPLSSRPVVTGVTPKAGVLPVNVIPPKQV